MGLKTVSIIYLHFYILYAGSKSNDKPGIHLEYFTGKLLQTILFNLWKFCFSELIWYLPSQNQIRCVWTDVSSCFEISCEMILVKHWEVANFWLARYCWTSWMFYLNLTPQPWKQKCVRDDYIKVIKYRTTRLKKWA